MLKRVWNAALGAAIILSVAYTAVTTESVVLWRVVAVLGLVVLPIAGAIAFLVIVWPTRYRYERPSGHVVRIHRVGGTAEILTPTGWRPLGALTDGDRT